MSSPAPQVDLVLRTIPVVKVEMVIRRPASDVFEVFVDPAHTTQFWFTRSSGRLEQGAKVRWEWQMYGAETEVTVLVVQAASRLVIEWDDPATLVEWTFTERQDGSTRVCIVNSGFRGTGDEVVAGALDSTGGFSYLLAAAKAYLEHGINLKLVADHIPDAHLPDWQAAELNA